MKSGTFIAIVESNGKVAIPSELIDRIQLAEGDKVEILMKKIRSRRFELNLRKNPLHRLLDIADQKTG